MEPTSKKALKAILVVVGILGIIALTWFAAMNYKSNSGKEEVSENKTETKSTVETKIINGIPTIEPGKVTEVKTTAATSPDQELIASYYNKLSQGDYQGAYDMKKYKRMDFSVFKNLYTNLKSTKFLDFIEVAPNQYDFIVELTNKDDTKERYRVWMQVEGNLLNTMSSNSTDEKPELRFVYGENGAITTLFLAQNGQKTIIDTAEKYHKDVTKNEEFNNVEITPGGEYLIYWKTGWEVATGKVYDIKQKKVVHIIDSQRGLYGFTNDMKHFYNCSESGMLSGNVDVSSVPSFELEKNLQQTGSLVFGCDGYDNNKNTLKYSLSFQGFTNKHTYEYNFDTGVVKEL